MYSLGQGVPEDEATAMSWLRKAADQGDAHALCQLGLAYYMGQGVPQDHVQAYKWLSLGASRFPAADEEHRDSAAKVANAIANEMTPAQIAEAQKLASEWKPKPPQ
jgi:TPR repeat protein